MKTKKVIVQPYDERWKTDFQEIKTELSEVLDDSAVRIEHVGSTAVEGMSAKPIIDVDVVISDYSVFSDVAGRLKEAGYIHEGDLGIAGREAFRYTGKEHLQIHHLYVCSEESRESKRHIIFRDFLRNNESAVMRYSKIKGEAARMFPDDIEGYIAHKAFCIENLYRQCGLETNEEENYGEN